jgi:alkylation response protein AidB-like acyl-CoA dehydrogenase
VLLRDAELGQPGLDDVSRPEPRRLRGLHAHGTPEQKATYLPKLTSGEWTGTMCLTEPHCGTDLGLLRTKAEPQADGSYKLTGQKIFISAGEHDLAANIVHLVLARLPDAPAGSKGISLFVVPKFKVKADGSLGERNASSAPRSSTRWASTATPPAR